jgi:hypothetical protein
MSLRVLHQWRKGLGVIKDWACTAHLSVCCLLAISLVVQGRLFAAEPENAVRLTPDRDVAAVVQNAPAGTMFIFAPGTYRMQSIIPKDNDVFRGEGMVVLNGSKLITMRAEGKWWSADEVSAKSDPTRCSNDHPRCWILNDLFIDDQIQTPVENLADMGPGQWFYDDNTGKVYISTNPSGHKVEFSMTTAGFSGMATGVQISHLIVEKYANPPQSGAIGGAHAKAQGWTVLNVEARWNHGTGISLGPSAHVESCNVHHNGQMGLGAVGANVTIVNNEIAYNNYAGYKEAWEAGGTKFALTDNLVVRSNYVHDNNGNGLWTDIDNIHSLYEKNKVINNKGEGLRHEISYDAIIRNNLLKGNKAGIMVVLSPNVEVYGNVIEVPVDGIDGIRVANGQRGVGAYGPHIAHDDHVHNNIITYLGPAGRSGLSGPLATATGVTFDSNEYHIIGGGDSHWIWSSGAETISAMRQAGLEQHATISKAPSTITDPTH